MKLRKTLAGLCVLTVLILACGGGATATPSPTAIPDPLSSPTPEPTSKPLPPTPTPTPSPPAEAQAHSDAGMELREEGKLGEAIAEFDQAIALFPEYTEAYNNRGAAYFYMGDLDRAVLDYNQAIVLDDEYVEAYNNRGTAYLQLGETDRAIEDYNQAVLFDVDYGDAYNNRGAAYYRIGQFERAIRDFGDAIFLDSEDAGAHFNYRMNNIDMTFPKSRSRIEDSHSRFHKIWNMRLLASRAGSTKRSYAAMYETRVKTGQSYKVQIFFSVITHVKVVNQNIGDGNQFFDLILFFQRYRTEFFASVKNREFWVGIHVIPALANFYNSGTVIS